MSYGHGKEICQLVNRCAWMLQLLAAGDLRQNQFASRRGLIHELFGLLTCIMYWGAFVDIVNTFIRTPLNKYLFLQGKQAVEHRTGESGVCMSVCRV